MTQIIVAVAVAGYHNADKCMEFLVQKTNFSTKNRTYTLPCFTLPIGIQKLLLTLLFEFFFFFDRKNINTQNIEFVKILTRDKYLIHVSFLTNPIFLCTGPKRVPKSVLHIVYNSCIYIYIYMYICVYVYVCMYMRTYIHF